MRETGSRGVVAGVNGKDPIWINVRLLEDESSVGGMLTQVGWVTKQYLGGFWAYHTSASRYYLQESNNFGP
jgi:hypothetical protein